MGPDGARLRLRRAPRGFARGRQALDAAGKMCGVLYERSEIAEGLPVHFDSIHLATFPCPRSPPQSSPLPNVGELDS